VLAFPPDWTFFVQIILFLILWTMLRRLLFEPNLVALANREQRSAGAIKEAEQITADAEGKGAAYRTQLAQARSGAMQEVEAVYREAEEQSRAVVEEARSDSAQTRARMREILEKEIAGARQDLEKRVPDFSNEIAERLLGRPLT
jgi:F-type H+-transporting ATPase subunit b